MSSEWENSMSNRQAENYSQTYPVPPETMNDRAVNQILLDPSVRFFCKEIIRVGMTKDAIDAIRDVELALKALKLHFRV